jgi:hypothetical protein
MSGAEVLGIISAIIAILDGASKTYNAIKDPSGLPQAFREVARRLPLVRETLQEIQGHLNDRNANQDFKAIKEVLDGCSDKATRLEEIFTNVTPKGGASMFRRLHLVMRTVGKGLEVERLMKELLADVQLLTSSRVMKLATDDGLERKLLGATRALTPIPPSTQPTIALPQPSPDLGHQLVAGSGEVQGRTSVGGARDEREG